VYTNCNWEERTYIEFEKFRIAFEKFSELILGSENRPMRRKVDVWHVVIPNWIVKNKLMVSLAPIITDSLISINYESVYTKHFEASCGCESSLAST
jgi:hypothetical protein